MNFTIDDNDKVNSKIQADLELITHKILELLNGKAHSILLCGGFGRGEGSVVASNGKIHIVNDYDFTIVLNVNNSLQYVKMYKKLHSPLEELANKLDINIEDY